MCVDMFDQTIRIFAHFEEIRLFFCRLYFPAAVRTFSVHKLGFRKERLARSTIHSLVISFVNISLIVKFLEDLLYLFFMIIIGCTDKFVIRCVHQIPDPFDLTGYIVHKLFWRNARFLRFQFDLLSMFVCSRLEKHIISLTSFISRDRVRKYDLISVSDMRFA